jgi:AcrR family transcriptional regulator
METKGEVHDRRVRKTRNRLRNALITLIREKDFDSITITDISERADVNRATFYVHYQDKEQVLEEIVDTYLSGLLEMFSVENTIDSFSYILEHANLVKALLSNKQIKDLFRKKMSLVLKRVYSERITLLTDNDERMSSEDEIYNTYAGSAILGMIEYWHKDDFRLSPAYMAGQLEAIAYQRPHRFLIR